MCLNRKNAEVSVRDMGEEVPSSTWGEGILMILLWCEEGTFWSSIVKFQSAFHHGKQKQQSLSFSQSYFKLNTQVGHLFCAGSAVIRYAYNCMAHTQLLWY